MKMTRAYLFTVSLIVGMNHASSMATGAPETDCETLRGKMDQDWVKIHLLGDPNITSFSSVQDLEERFCKPFISYTKSTTSYSKCLKAFSRQLVSTLARSTKAIHRKVCGDPVKLEEAFRHIKCMNSSTKPALARSIDILTSFVTHISKLQDADEIIPSFCCSVGRVQDYTEAHIDGACGSGGPDSDGHYMGAIVYTAWADFIEILCGRPKSREENSCRKLSADKITATENSFINVVNYSHGLAIPFVDIVLKLEGVRTIDE